MTIIPVCLPSGCSERASVGPTNRTIAMGKLTTDEAAGMAWWNNMTDEERSSALKAAIAAGNVDPSAYDAWCVYKVNNETD